MKIFNLILIICSVICLVITCKPKDDTRPFGHQYEEDPGPERGTVSERLEGNWHIEDYLRNDTSIIHLSMVATSSTINIKDVYWEYRRPTKENDWYETSYLHPWKWYGSISRDSITYGGHDISFFYWFTNPLKLTDSIKYKSWYITKLHQNSLHLRLVTKNGTYKIFWKK